VRQLGCAGLRVDAAAVGHQAGAVGARHRRHCRHEVDRVFHVAGARLARALPLQQRHGELGQEVERQRVEPAVLQQFHRRVEGIAPEAAAAADARDLGAHLALPRMGPAARACAQRREPPCQPRNSTITDHMVGMLAWPLPGVNPGSGRKTAAFCDRGIAAVQRDSAGPASQTVL
jgi:hypothetical protein